MGVAEILAGIDTLFSLIAKFYSLAKMLAGETPIPPLEEIAKKNTDLQAQIDAELNK